MVFTSFTSILELAYGSFVLDRIDVVEVINNRPILKSARTSIILIQNSEHLI
jgi:hypothetical protein